MMPFWGVRGKNRSQSATLGVALLFAIVVLGMAAVVVMAAGPITTAENSIAIDRAEQTLTQLDAQMAKVALGKSNGQSIDLGEARSGYQVDSDAGWIKVKRAGGTNPLPKTPLGAIYYERGDTELAYQGGGVWKKTEEGGMRMISPPEFHYRDGTLTLPLISLSSSDGTYEGRTSLTQASAPVQKFPSGAATNPVSSGVTVVVKSEYYKAWGKYFRERTEGIVRYDHDKNKAFLKLVTPIGNAKVKNAMAALSSGSRFKISGSPAHTCKGKLYADSYDSDSGTYCSQPLQSSADIVYGGSADIDQGSGNGNIYGMVKSDEIWYSQSGGGKPDVTGKLKYVSACHDCPAAKKERIATIPTRAPIDGYVNRRVAGIKEANDNDEAGVPISGNTLDGGDQTLTAGTYYLSEIDLNGDKLTLDTTGGNIKIAVQDTVHLGSGTIEVTGPNHVKFYVDGTASTTDWEFKFKQGDVFVPDDDTEQFRILGKSSFRAKLRQGIFQGVIFAPSDASSPGEVLLDKKAVIFGGVLTGDTELDTKSAIHYDEALKDTQIINPNAKIARITYLHISVSEVTLDN